jgi:hypothetical protein
MKITYRKNDRVTARKNAAGRCGVSEKEGLEGGRRWMERSCFVFADSSHVAIKKYLKLTGKL